MGKYTTYYISAGPYEGAFRETAKKVKDNDMGAILRAAEMLSEIIPLGTVLVPMPSHTGRPTYILDICNILKQQYGYKISECLRCHPRESICEQKKKGPIPSPYKLGFFIAGTPPKDRTAIIDNVIATGTTARAAGTLLKEATVYCIADDTTQKKIKGVKKKTFVGHIRKLS